MMKANGTGGRSGTLTVITLLLLLLLFSFEQLEWNPTNFINLDLLVHRQFFLSFSHHHHHHHHQYEFGHDYEPDKILSRRLTEEQEQKQQQKQKDDEQDINFARDALARHLPLFEISDFTVVGPTAFPEPSRLATQQLKDGEELVHLLRPRIGSHRPDQDAVFIFAEEYPLTNYIVFISTLRDTGFDGDLVMAISPIDYKDPLIRKYLESQPNIVVYVIKFTCYNAEWEIVESMKGGIRVCHCHNVYGKRPTTNQDGTVSASIVTPLEDARNPRTAQTTRYELYWNWIANYQTNSWIMLIDARDSVFQTNPFVDLPREHDENKEDGLLYFFGENMEATRLGKSNKNRKWLQNAYGTAAITALQDKPTICSGSTMGEQIAMETYLRAMVAESDETGVVLMGADQGFHNYLYYSNKLGNAQTIRKIVVFDQGSSFINNLGALRTQELSTWGNGKIVKSTTMKQGSSTTTGTKHEVYNWDGQISPVVHQYDRHKLLSEYFYKIKSVEYRNRWDKQMKQDGMQHKKNK